MSGIVLFGFIHWGISVNKTDKILSAIMVFISSVGGS